MSRILRDVHKSARILDKGGFLDDTTMREFDAMCLPKPIRKPFDEDEAVTDKMTEVSDA